VPSLRLLASTDVAGLPSPVDVCDVSIVSAAVLPTVNHCSICKVLLLLLASLLNIAGFSSTASAVIPDANNVHAIVGLLAHILQASPAFAGVHTVLAVLLLLSFLLLLVFLLLWTVTLLLSSLLFLVVGLSSAAFVTAVACIPAIAGIPAVTGVPTVPDVITIAGLPAIAGGPSALSVNVHT
jgi:hypothetical protein